MRVGFDAHMIGHHETGNEAYARGVLSGCAAIGFPLDVYSFGPIPGGVHRNHRLWPRQSVIRIPLTTPLLARRDHLDLYHATYVLPPLVGCATVVSIHDITYALHPEWFPAGVRRMLSALVPMAIRKARRIVTISQASKRDIVACYGVAPERIAVTYLAPRPEFSLPTQATAPREPFMLYVGNVQPRKNLETVLRALAVLQQRGRSIALTVAGAPGFGFEGVQRLVRDLGLERIVQFLGYVSDEDLCALYASCTALVHPALYEGFGLTLLEAMAQGAPVLAADTSSVPEVVGDAALLLPALDPEAWADAIDRIGGDDELRIDLAHRGHAQASRFSWERCARETVDVYTAALEV